MTDRSLKTGDLLTYRRLSASQPHGSGTKGPRLRNCHESAEMANLDTIKFF